MTGEADLYLYPDTLTVLQGAFDLGKLKEGHIVRLAGIQAEVRQFFSIEHNTRIFVYFTRSKY